MRAKLGFALVRATVLCLCGSCTRWRSLGFEDGAAAYIVWTTVHYFSLFTFFCNCITCSVSNQLSADVYYRPGKIRVKTREFVILCYLVLLCVVLSAV